VTAGAIAGAFLNVHFSCSVFPARGFLRPRLVWELILFAFLVCAVWAFTVRQINQQETKFREGFSLETKPS